MDTKMKEFSALFIPTIGLVWMFALDNCCGARLFLDKVSQGSLEINNTTTLPTTEQAYTDGMLPFLIKYLKDENITIETTGDFDAYVFKHASSEPFLKYLLKYLNETTERDGDYVIDFLDESNETDWNVPKWSIFTFNHCPTGEIYAAGTCRPAE